MGPVERIKKVWKPEKGAALERALVELAEEAEHQAAILGNSNLILKIRIHRGQASGVYTRRKRRHL